MRIDIKKEHFEIVRDILNKHLHSDDRVFVFGSRVKGKAKKMSDLDLAVVTEKSLLEIREAFSESDLPYFVDVLNYKDIPRYMRDEIDSHKIELAKVMYED